MLEWVFPEKAKAGLRIHLYQPLKEPNMPELSKIQKFWRCNSNIFQD